MSTALAKVDPATASTLEPSICSVALVPAAPRDTFKTLLPFRFKTSIISLSILINCPAVTAIEASEATLKAEMAKGKRVPYCEFNPPGAFRVVI